jgi:hypothetical protein
MSSFMLLRRSLGAIATHRLIKRCSPPGESELFLEDMIVRLSDAARLSATPALAVLPSDVSGAFVVGARRRWILLSRDLIDELDGEELEGIIAHEIAHLEARDVHVVFGAGLLRDMVAWNPIGHVAFRRLVADRELEADRRAAAMTGRPLAVASGLLKVCELMSSKHGLEARATVAMARPGGRVARRVARLIDISDGKTAALSNDNRLPYLMAALLVAILGLQVGARMANDHIGALAVVWGTQPSNALELWRPEQMGALRSRSPLHRGPKATSDDRAALLKHVLSDKALAAGVALKERDVHRWMDHVVSLARRIGIPAGELRYEFRQDWRAEPLFESRLGSLTRMQRLPP